MIDISKKWLRVIGIGEDGWDDLTVNARDLLLVYGALLMEERIVLASKDMNVSAACAEALQSLLYPLVIRVRTLAL